jgi:Mrr N-terminal domain
MRPDVSVKLPDHGAIGKALIEILVKRHNRALRASEAYEILAEYFQLDWKQLNVKVATRDERKWHNRCRTARGHLVKTGKIKRLPFDKWSLTEETFKYPDPTRSDVSGVELGF